MVSLAPDSISQDFADHTGFVRFRVQVHTDPARYSTLWRLFERESDQASWQLYMTATTEESVVHELQRRIEEIRAKSDARPRAYKGFDVEREFAQESYDSNSYQKVMYIQLGYSIGVIRRTPSAGRDAQSPWYYDVSTHATHANGAKTEERIVRTTNPAEVNATIDRLKRTMQASFYETEDAIIPALPADYGQW